MDKRSLLFVALLAAALFFVNQWFSAKSPVSQPEKTVTITKTPSTFALQPEEQKAISVRDQQFYVLENNYQQLVFSTVGGALSEINLALKSPENPSSVVLPIEIDRILKDDYPQYDQFPLESYIADGEKKQSMLNGYYPLLRRGFPESPIRPRYYALNLLSEDPSQATLVYDVKRCEKNLIEFEALQSHRKITKTYSLPDNPDAAPYCFELKIKVEGNAKGLYLSSGVPEVELISGSAVPSLKYRITRNHKSQVEQLDLPKASLAFSSIHPDWICNSNGFFGLIIDPLTEVGAGFNAEMIPGTADPTRLSVIDSQYNLYPAEKYPGYEMTLPLNTSSHTSTFRVYAGPFTKDILQKVDSTYSNAATGYTPDYTACQSFHGWFAFISGPFAKFLFFLMNAFYYVTHSWGISIILLTVALRIMLYPLNGWSMKSAAKMQQIAPQVTALQEKYKKDPKRAQMEIIGLYREKGVNPITGCLPLLIQMPFLIGMFDLLKTTFELRGASFIPGWIDNLTAPDVVVRWNYPLIFFGTALHLLPLLLGVVMYLQQKFASPLPKDSKLWTDQQRQQKFMGNIMTIVFAVMFYHFPSGLNIYWLSSMLLGILQQWYTNKKLTVRPIK